MSGLRGHYLVAAAMVLLAVGGLIDSGLGEAAFVAGTVLLPAALLWMVGAGGPRRRSGRWAALAVVVLLGSGFALLLAFRGRGSSASWWFDLPAPLAIQIAMALVPLIVLGFLFARRFDRFRPSRDALEKIRSLSDAES
jgi:hypothetical protein